MEKLKFLSNQTSDTPIEMKMLKLMEEVGEASQALLKMSGQYNASDSAKIGSSDFLEEIVDIFIILEDIIHRMDPEKTKFDEIRGRKIDKWESKVKKRKMF